MTFSLKFYSGKENFAVEAENFLASWQKVKILASEVKYESTYLLKYLILTKSKY